MEKMMMETADLTQKNIDKIAELFPNCITEVLDKSRSSEQEKVYKKAVNFDLLRQMLSSDVVDGDEAYEFTWVGKKASIVEANKPIRKTLRPCPEESVDWDSTENLYIEGDNLEVLKLLQESYLEKVKLIYIDPPYNTGNDFIYRDKFAISADDYVEQLGVFDDDGTRLFKNTDSNGRFHSDWCSMIYSRLLLARNIMSEDGLICISIDSNEIDNLRKICDEVFGNDNFVAEIIVQNNPRGRQSDRFVATVHEYLLCYSKDSAKCVVNGTPLTDEQKAEYSNSDENGDYRLLGLRQRGVASLREDRPDMYFPVFVNPDNLEVSLDEKTGWIAVYPKKSDGRDGRWMWGKEKCIQDINRLVPRMIERRNEYDIFVKDYLVRDGETRTRKYKTIWDDKAINNQVGTQEVKSLFGAEVMSFPKSCAYIQMILQMGCFSDSIIMDFFSGSATTAHAVLEMNKNDNGRRKFIMVQLPERCDESSSAKQAGYDTICEIGKERIRRAGRKIKEDNPLTTGNLDIGFRVLKLDESNMNDVYYAAGDYTQDLLTMAESNIKSDRTDLDLLFGCLLDWGLPLSMPYSSETIDGATVHIYNNGDLIACFSKDVSEEVIKTIAKKKPLRVVFRDSSFKDSPAKINVGEIFKMLSPDTRIKVI